MYTWEQRTWKNSILIVPTTMQATVGYFSNPFHVNGWYNVGQYEKKFYFITQLFNLTEERN